MKIFWNIVVWAITLVPASFWWYKTMANAYRTAISWADKVSVCIIALIYIVIVAANIIAFCGIASGINVFGVP